MYCARAAAIRDGSSPHTRGTPLGSHCWRSNPRFIPAYAGNAKSLAPHSSPHSVHPRIRGERGAGLSGRGGRCGSSPHTRGTQDGRLSSLMENRFIPAYAGNARCLCSQRTPAPVHPRIRGERRVRRPAADLCGGSSPHTRGTPRPRTRCTMAFRFIPAYAGNAQMPGPISRPHAVHPRIRGERSPPRTASMPHFGSSPHTRGTLPFPHCHFFISSVHPRIRGERWRSQMLSGKVIGSSPHTRGTRVCSR